MSEDAYQAEIRRILDTVLRIRDDRFGFDESDVIAAERRLGISIPPPLRFMYRYVGRHTLWRESHHPLVPPDDLTIENGHLVFLDECQAVVEYLLQPQEAGWEDPPVYLRNPVDPDVLNEEANSLSTFLLESMCWQIVLIGDDLEENVTISVGSFYAEQMSHDRARREVAGMRRVSLEDNSLGWSTAAYYSDRAIAFLFVDEQTTTTYSWAECSEDDD